MTNEDWVVDDASIPDDAYAHRRLTSKDHVILDASTGRYSPSTAAYPYRDDGMSVCVSTAMSAEGVADNDLLPYCVEGLARFQILTVRRADVGTPYQKGNLTSGTVAAGEALETRGGVILKEAKDGPPDERIRRSHGLIRIPEPPLARPIWNAFRHKLIQGSEIKRTCEDDWNSI